MGQPRFKLERHEPVGTAGVLVNREEHVGRHLHIGQREVVEDLDRAPAILLCDLADGVVVVRRIADRLAEDARVGGETADAVLADEPLQAAAGDEASSQEIQPDALSGVVEAHEWIHRSFPSVTPDRCCRTKALARSATCPAANPSSRMTLLQARTHRNGQATRRRPATCPPDRSDSRGAFLPPPATTDISARRRFAAPGRDALVLPGHIRCYGRARVSCGPVKTPVRPTEALRQSPGSRSAAGWMPARTTPSVPIRSAGGCVRPAVESCQATPFGRPRRSG